MMSWGSEYKFENMFCRDMMLFHDMLVGMLLFLGVFVSGLLFDTFMSQHVTVTYVEGHLLETVWTIFPMSFVLCIFFPSLVLLNSKHSLTEGFSIVKVMGHQWYWEYRYNTTSSQTLNYESYPTELGMMRNLETSSVVVLESSGSTELNVTSSDVMHSFALPSVGIKLDAIPGRVNSNLIEGTVNSCSLLLGQCSEICGVYHGKMPIVALFM